MKPAILTLLFLAVPLLAVPINPPKAGKPAKASSSLPMKQIRLQAAKIDDLVERGLQAQGLKPNPTISDTRFVRRAFLSLTGRIPTLDELDAFDSSTVPDKRQRLIRDLLTSSGYVSHYYNFWADILRLRTSHPNLAIVNVPSGQAYIDWVKRALRTNQPYDEMVHELLTARGGLWDRNNGAVGYYFRDFGMPLDHLANTAQIFLGTQIQCAQCHDHPFDKWSQKAFYEMAAYTHGQGNMTSRKNYLVNKQLPREEVSAGVQGMKLISRQAMYELTNTGNGFIQLPKDYQYDNGKPGEVVKATPLYGTAKRVENTVPPKQANGKKSPPHPGNHARAVFADWVVSSDNPRFNTVIANRLWKQVMGLGLIEPVDDLRDDSLASNPPLMRHLEQLMVALDYDMRAYLEILHNTKTWQRASSRTQAVAGEAYAFQGPVLRRLTAEQMWDSLLVLTKHNVERPRPHAPSPLFNLRDQAKKLDVDAYLELVKKMPATYATEESGSGAIYRGMAKSKLEASNSFSIEERRREINDEIRRLEKERKGVWKRKEWAKDKPLLKQLAVKRAQLAANTHFRASEMVNPLPPNHFVRTFGGSDRTLIENASDEASISQVLALLNGFVDYFVLGQRASVLQKNLLAAPDKDSKIRTAFRSILSREPSAQELAMMRPEVSSDIRGCDNLVWALINTHEFMALQ